MALKSEGCFLLRKWWLAGPVGASWGTGGKFLTGQKARLVMAESGKADRKQTIDTHNNVDEFQKLC